LGALPLPANSAPHPETQPKPQTRTQYERGSLADTVETASRVDPSPLPSGVGGALSGSIVVGLRISSVDLAAAAASKSKEGVLRFGRRRIDVGGGDLVPHKMSHDHVSCLMERNTPRAYS